MAGIDFVPEDYIQRQEFNRANYLYMGLLVLMVSAFLSTFGFLKLRQKALDTEDAAVDIRLAKAQESIAQLEQLQRQRQEMIKTALLTAELIEPLPRSIVLALLTNSMPDGLSLSQVKLLQKKLNSADLKRYKTKYEKLKSANPESANKDDFVNMLEIHGLASSDIPVADYIANLTSSMLLDEVSLVHSKEFETKNGTYRQFKLSAILKTNITLTKLDVENIGSHRNFNSRGNDLELNK
ncbi:MAG: PilN domain-containing protein [Anaerohalosphaeraceae bacterium]|nr:PilN domain-containing protein [Anaerohalosphaeraceae bacterium]